MKKSIICFTLGLSPKDIQAGMVSFYHVDQTQNRLDITPLREELFGWTVSDAVDSRMKTVETNALPENSEIAKPANTAADLTVFSDYRAMLIDTDGQRQVLQIMRSFKKVLPHPQDMIFAMITPTARNWTFQNYFDHLVQEHEHFKTHSAAGDRNMKRIE